VATFLPSCYTGYVFDDLTDIYEAMIDWPKRLANEEPFYRRWFERAGVQSVVDVACGTGRHAAMFHSWGRKGDRPHLPERPSGCCTQMGPVPFSSRVEGADISPNMIHRARTTFGEPAGLRWVVRRFDEPIAAAKPFDAAICVGNSLALAPDPATVQRAIGQMLAAVRTGEQKQTGGGIAIVHVLNLWSLPDGPCNWQKCQRATLPQGEVLILKGVHRCGTRGYVDLIVAGLGEEKASLRLLHSESIPLLGLEAADLQRMASAAGAAEVAFFGGYQDQPYDRRKSADLIMVARRF